MTSYPWLHPLCPLNCDNSVISGMILYVVVGIHNASWKRMKNIVVGISNMLVIALFGCFSLIFLTVLACNVPLIFALVLDTIPRSSSSASSSSESLSSSSLVESVGFEVLLCLKVLFSGSIFSNFPSIFSTYFV